MKMFRGWGIVAAAHVLLALAFGAAYSFGAFFEGIQTHFGAGRFPVASLFAVTALLYYTVGAFAGALADRFALRAVVGAGVVLLASGFALASQAPSLASLFLLFGLFAGCGVGLIYVPAVVAVQRWFVRLRSRASGLALAGTGMGTFAAPLLAGWLQQRLGWQAAMLWFALGIALVGLAAAWSIEGRPTDLGLSPDGDGPATHTSQPVPGASLADALAQPRFWWFFMAILLGSISLFAALVHIVPQARGLGIAPTASHGLIALIGVGNVLGRPVLGAVGDRIGPLRLLWVLAVALAVLHLLWGLATGWAMLALFALLFGAAHGGCIALYPAVAAQWFGTRRLGAILGALYVSVGLAAVVGASASGWVFDSTGSYAAAIAASGALALLACVGLVGAARQGRHFLSSSPSIP